MGSRDDDKIFEAGEKESSTSSSSQESTSTPNTPPSPHAQPHTPPQLLTPPPVVVTPPPRNVRYNKPSPGKSPKTPSPSKSRLGVIDEDSEAMSPDIPDRNPLRRLGVPPMKFHLPNIPTLHAKRNPPQQSPPENLYDDVQGPKGEKFSDLRKNRKSGSSSGLRRRFGWKLWCCAGTLIVVVVLALVLGLVFGLRARNRELEDSDSGENSGLTGAFPVGRYSITTYLNTVNSSCTSDSATWRCAPYQTYSESPSGSMSTLNWIVRIQNGGQYTISSDNSIFDYPFQNVPLTLRNNGTANEYWEFVTTFNKQVTPSASITNDGSQSRCFYNNTSLTGSLYTKRSKAPVLQSNATAPTGDSTVNQPWPYALSFYEAHNNGVGVPDCYKYVNGQIGDRIQVNDTITSGGTRQCSCQYANFF